MNIVLLILVVLLIAGLPQTGLHPFGYFPSGGVGLIILILVILLVLGKL